MATTPTTPVLPRQEGLRPADPERERLRQHHRHARRTQQGRAVDRRYRRRHVCLQQYPGGLAATADRRPRPAHRYQHARGHGRVDGLPAVLRLRRRTAAAACRRGARHDLSLRPVCHRRRQDGHAGAAERTRMAGLLRQGAAAAGAGPRPAFCRQCAACGAAGRAARDHRRRLRRHDGRTGDGAAGRGADRQCAGQRHGRPVAAPAAGGAGPLA